MDIINDGILWNQIIKSIAEKCGNHTFSGIQFGTDGTMILCDNHAAAEIIADFLEMIGYYKATTGTYDEEDGKTWYYIDID